MTSDVHVNDIDHGSAEDAEDRIADEAEDVNQHAREARIEYEAARGLYVDYARSLERVLSDCLTAKQIVYHSITSRAKDLESFERKAAQLSPEGTAKYSNPIEEITDKTAARIITYFLNTVDEVAAIISEQFEVLEQERKASDDPTRFGYQSTHYLVRLSSARSALPEYARFRDIVAEIQVRTILQHAWAEIEHDIQYKSSAVLPRTIQRRFAALAGLVEISDREFQAIDDENRAIQVEARRKIDIGGDLDKVEITADSVRAYLDKNYGPDGRMSDFSYQWTARLLLRLGFANLAEVQECVNGYSDDNVSRVAFKSRRGQLTRFETVLLASMGDAFILGHPWFTEHSYGEWWYARQLVQSLDRLKAAGVATRNFKPPHYPESLLSNSADLEDLRQRLADEAAATGEDAASTLDG